MRNLKKILALALALVMAMSLTTFVSASDFSDDADISYKEAVDVMTAIGVIDGMDDGSFDPNGTLTREQAAALICRMMLGKDGAEKLNTTYAPFDDVAATRWSAPYIAYCVEQGYIVGESTTTFNPTGKLTGHAFAKLLLCVLGYDPIIETYTGASWAVNVATDAVSAGIAVDGLLMGNEISREEAAQMAFQTLTATMVRYASKGTNIELENGTIINTGASDPEAVENNSTTNRYDGEADGEMQFCERYFDDLKKTSAGRDDLGRPASEWTYDSDDIGTYADSADDTVVINNDDSATYASVLTSSDYFNLRSSDLAGTIAYYLNGEPVSSTGTALQPGDVVEIFEDSNNDVATVVVSQYRLAKIDDVDTDVSDRDAKNDVTAYITLEDMGGTAVGNGTYNDTDINGYNASTYEEGAYLAVAVRDDTNEIVASYVADTAEGTVTTSSSKAVTLGGTKYGRSGMEDASSVRNFDFDDTNYIAYLTTDGYVLGIDGTEAVSLDDVYYVNGVYFSASASGNATYYAQVVDMDGNESEVVLEETAFKDTLNAGNALDASPDANHFYSIDALYILSDKDAVAVGAPNFGGQNATVAAKSNNDKYSVKVYNTAAADGDYYIVDSTVDGNVTSSSKSIVMDAAFSGSTKSAYITSSTKFILVDRNSSNDDVDIEVYTGSARIADGKNAMVIASKSGSSYEAAVVIVGDTGISTGVVNTDSVFYLTGSSSTKVKDGYEATVYFMDGSNETVTIDAAGSEGFWTFSINSDGVYEIGAAAGNVSLVGSTYDDETGVIADTTIDSIYNNAYLSFTGGQYIDIALADDLQIVDARDPKTVYENEINTLSKLQAAMNRGSVTATAFVDNGEVLLISVTGMGLSSDSNSAGIQSDLDADDAATINTDLSQAVNVTVGNGQTLTVSAPQSQNHTITVKAGGKLVLPNGTEIGGSAIASNADLVVTSLNNGQNIRISASSGTITLTSNVTLSSGDELILSGNAQLVGTSSEQLTINGTVTVATSNFYTSGNAQISAGTIETGTYTWTADANGAAEGTVPGWVKNA